MDTVTFLFGDPDERGSLNKTILDVLRNIFLVFSQQ
jgi:hypothetical protein